MIPKMEKKIRKRFPFKDFPPVKELEKKTVLMLINTDPSFDNQEPLESNMIRVPGLQIQKPKDLPMVI